MLNLVRPFQCTLAVAAATAITGLSMTTALANTITVRPGETLWSISRANGTTLQSLESVNPGLDPNNLRIGTVLQLPKQTSSSPYVVKPGDTLWKLSQRFHVSVGQLTAANPWVNPVNLWVGTTIHIPQISVKPTTTSPATPAVSTSATNSQNLYWMEHVINAEAGGESLRAQIAVGDVVLHRLQSGDYGATVKDVVFQVSNGHYQFTSVANGYIDHAPNASSVQAALDVLQNHEDVVPGALVFYNPSKTPAGSWVWSQPTLSTIGHFVFAK